MPQFDPTTFPSQIFWLAVSFIALYWVVARLAIPRVGEVIEQRARLVQEDIDRATTLKAETDHAIAAYEQAMADARAQAQDHIRGIALEIRAVADKKTAEVTATVNAQITDAEVRIAKAKTDALAGMRTMAAETARDVVGKLAALAPDAGTVDAAVAAALKETR
ncbi:MAG: F0F1 ATP synthase subunit B' [Rhodospirillaceae bacterium]|nr:MAG: F0F1 ATP synthase subunit B' [Rhodospirillaceae bacterium]